MKASKKALYISALSLIGLTAFSSCSSPNLKKYKLTNFWKKDIGEVKVVDTENANGIKSYYQYTYFSDSLKVHPDLHKDDALQSNQNLVRVYHLENTVSILYQKQVQPEKNKNYDTVQPMRYILSKSKVSGSPTYGDFFQNTNNAAEENKKHYLLKGEECLRSQRSEAHYKSYSIQPFGDNDYKHCDAFIFRDTIFYSPVKAAYNDFYPISENEIVRIQSLSLQNMRINLISGYTMHTFAIHGQDFTTNTSFDQIAQPLVITCKNVHLRNGRICDSLFTVRKETFGQWTNARDSHAYMLRKNEATRPIAKKNPKFNIQTDYEVPFLLKIDGKFWVRNEFQLLFGVDHYNKAFRENDINDALNSAYLNVKSNNKRDSNLKGVNMRIFSDSKFSLMLDFYDSDSVKRTFQVDRFPNTREKYLFKCKNGKIINESGKPYKESDIPSPQNANNKRVFYSGESSIYITSAGLILKGVVQMFCYKHNSPGKKGFQDRVLVINSVFNTPHEKLLEITNSGSVFHGNLAHHCFTRVSTNGYFIFYNLNYDFPCLELEVTQNGGRDQRK